MTEILQREEPEPIIFLSPSPDEVNLIRASIKQKLVDGQPLTAEEAALLVGV